MRDIQLFYYIVYFENILYQKFLFLKQKPFSLWGGIIFSLSLSLSLSLFSLLLHIEKRVRIHNQNLLISWTD